MRAAYDDGTTVWTGGTREDLAALGDTGITLDIAAESVETLPLYVVQLPDAVSDTDPVALFGEIVDQAGRTLIVRVPSAPAVVLNLINIGYSAEKFPPFVPAGWPILTMESVADLPPASAISDDFPDLSNDSVEATLRDLTSSGVEPAESGSRFYSLPGNAIAAEYLYLRFTEIGMAVWFEDYVAPNGMLSVNVVAEIPSADESEIYGIFAHFDTIAEDVASNDLAPGALDNGTGLAVLIDVARVLSGYRLEHPVRFVALNGEEVGLLGATAFGSQAIRDGTPFADGINVDSVGTAYGERRLIVNAAPSALVIQDTLVERYNALGFELNIQVRQNPAIVSDEVPLTNAGIPTILVASMVFGDPLINCTCDTIDGVDIDDTRATGRLVLLTLGVLTSYQS